ncbi:MAG: hypothetical protein DI556_13385 [Rhodovulum sulfidophilum]|uniref:Conjugal transfer protein TraW n=1 Tax=Rhodovulum sulfidophilum TaxID=35806 RepID=A0A2W5N5R4_RHOSU|nr:MAG: hypothetical protein DI556_13385 [Rhodovulum sulfidophilum]
MVRGAVSLALAALGAAGPALAASEEFMPRNPIELRAEDIRPRRSVTIEMPSYDDLVRPGQDQGRDLPSYEELARPDGIERFEGIAREIARQSSDEAMGELRRRASVLGVGPSAQPEVAGIRKLPEGYRATILLSLSMGEEGLRGIFAKFAGRSDVRFAFRGVPDDMTVPDFALTVAKIAAGDDSGRLSGNFPAVLDPVIFDAVEATAVPLVIVEDLSKMGAVAPGRDLGAVVMRASGVSDADYAFERFEAGEAALSQGPLFAIEEEDLIARAKREALVVEAGLTRDPDRLRDRYWSGQQGRLEAMPITPAVADDTRQLFFAYVPSEDIRDSEGNVIAYAGQVFSPNDVLPWNRRMFVFDPMDPDEVAFIERLRAEPREGIAREIFLVTNLADRAAPARPWEVLQGVVDRFRQPAFLLTDEVLRSFQIRHTPTEIYPELVDGRVEVFAREYSLK